MSVSKGAQPGEPPISAQINSLRSTVKDLQGVVSELRARLIPVTNPKLIGKMDGRKVSDEHDDQDRSPIAMSLEDIQYGLSEIYVDIRNHMQALEI